MGLPIMEQPNYLWGFASVFTTDEAINFEYGMPKSFAKTYFKNTLKGDMLLFSIRSYIAIWGI